jgi:hypothetical protein
MHDPIHRTQFEAMAPGKGGKVQATVNEILMERKNLCAPAVHQVCSPLSSIYTVNIKLTNHGKFAAWPEIRALASG